jgi:hypothetical protein
MKTLTKLFAVLAFLLAPQLLVAQQNFLTQTTLSAAIPGQYLGPGPTGNVPAPTIITVASATGIVGIQPFLGVTAGQPVGNTNLYIDREQMRVTAVNGTALTVVRGVNGTIAVPHSNGAMVLAGPARFFYTTDPGGIGATGTVNAAVSNVPCVVANVVVSPWVNVRSGAQWYCNPNSLVWTPGFNNPQLRQGASFATTASVAGATNIAGPVTKISGTNAITSWTFTGNGAIGVAGSGTAATTNSQTSEFCVIPTGLFTTTATNNIGAATTAIVGVMQCWEWNGPDGKWYQIP